MLTPLIINEMGLIHAKEVHYTGTTLRRNAWTGKNSTGECWIRTL